MPLPKSLARFNLKVTNRITGPFAHRLPGFAIVHHIGRKSGTERTTPVNMFRDGDDYVIALTYGRDSQWVKNVLAAGEFDVVTRGKRVRLHDPRVVHHARVPAPVRAILNALNVDDYVVARPSPSK
jgi:deazaflavin-dependent oxidoreductase (nitroreductase family)